MNPNLKVFAALKVNGIVTQWPQAELRHIPVMLGRFILESEMDSRMFSTMELRLSKRPIIWDSQLSENQQLLAGLGNAVELVGLDEPIDSHDPPISYGELSALSDDPIWTSYKSLTTRPRDDYTADEYQAIVIRWKEKYANTKFARLI